MKNKYFLLILIIINSVCQFASADNNISEEQKLSKLMSLLREQDETQSKLFSAKSFRCEFEKGNMFEVVNNKFKNSEQSFGEATFIDNVDLEQKSARIIGNNGSEDLALIATGNGLNFIELPGATFNLYTIFSKMTNSEDEFYATTSRHVLLMGKVMLQQYPGKCKIWSQNKAIAE